MMLATINAESNAETGGRCVLEALIVVGVLGYGAIAYRQWHTMLAASDNSTKALETTERTYVTALQTTEWTLQGIERSYITALQTTERAYVTFGSKSGELGEFIDNPMPGEKRLIVLHFYNSGHSTARHLAIHAVTDNQTQSRADIGSKDHKVIL